MLVWKTTWVSWIFLMVAGWVVPTWVKRIARRAGAPVSRPGRSYRPAGGSTPKAKEARKPPGNFPFSVFPGQPSTSAFYSRFKMTFNNRIALVAGAGVTVICVSKSAGSCGAVAAAITAAGGKAGALAVDMSGSAA
jgi:hypothetical protein